VDGAGRVRFNHVKCAPSAALAPFVDHYWLTRWDRRGQPPRTASSLLDPCVPLQVEDGRGEVMGVVRRTFRMSINGVGCIIGVKFRPGGFYPFVQRAVSSFTDRVIPVDEVFVPVDARDASWASEMWNAAVECSGDAAVHSEVIATHLDAFLGARIPARDAAAEEAGALVALIATSAALRKVSDLVDASGRSERTLDRLFARYVGVSPGWVIRRHRLQGAAARLTAYPPASVPDVAWELGYADQAHLIRDFRDTIGITPGAYTRARP